MTKRALAVAGIVLFFLALSTQITAAQVTSAQTEVKSVRGPAIRPWDDREAVTEIGFGSCLRQNRPAPIFRTLAETPPDVFVFLGDNIYGDTEDPKVFHAKYQAALTIPGFRELRRRSTVLAIWDDHDYGLNDAGVEFSKKQMAKQFFVDFWGEPKSSTRVGREGNYGSAIFGPAGKRVQFILLDTRWFRSPLVELPERAAYGPYGVNHDPASTILGDEQWRWLTAELAKPAEVRIICSSIQTLPTEHNWEKWGNYPHERARLLELLDQADGVIFAVSGDRHTGELSRLQLPSGRFVVDLTASALNQGDGLPKEEPNALRVGKPVTEPHAGWISIDWEAREVRLQLRRESGSVIQETRERFERLSPQK